jgi:hypothetical protein
MKDSKCSYYQRGACCGPMTFRFILQPTMATIAALYDGVKDARTGRSPYLWTILSNPEKRGDRLREGMNTLRSVFRVAQLRNRNLVQNGGWTFSYPHLASVFL